MTAWSDCDRSERVLLGLVNPSTKKQINLSKDNINVEICWIGTMKTELYRPSHAIRSLLQVLLIASITGSWAEEGHKTDKNVQTLQIPPPASDVAVF